jgi:hypothetical protein
MKKTTEKNYIFKEKNSFYIKAGYLHNISG